MITKDGRIKGPLLSALVGQAINKSAAKAKPKPLKDGLSLLSDKKKRCNARIRELKNAKNKTVFHSNGILAEQLKKMVIDEIIAEFKAAR